MGERKEEVNARYMYAGGHEPRVACVRPFFLCMVSKGRLVGGREEIGRGYVFLTYFYGMEAREKCAAYIWMERDYGLPLYVVST